MPLGTRRTLAIPAIALFAGCAEDPAIVPEVRNELSISVAGSGSGLMQLSVPGLVGSTCPDPITGSCKVLYDEQTRQVTITVSHGPTSIFLGWTGDCEGTGPCTVSMDRARAVTATFAPAPPTYHRLVLTIAGTGSGSVGLTGVFRPGGDCLLIASASCVWEIPIGTTTQVRLTAFADEEAVFNGWTGGTCQGTDPCTFAMDQTRHITANFGRLNFLQLTIAGTGAGTVTLSTEPGAASTCGSVAEASCFASFQEGPVTLTAAPLSGSFFLGWTGACAGNGPCVVNMSQARTVTATFVPAAVRSASKPALSFR